MRALSALAIACLLGGCGDRDAAPEPEYDAGRARRVIHPPSGEVRAVPPHAIHDRGVGPYRLGSDLKTILELLPRGPRVTLMEIEGLLDYSLVRAEADLLLIGVERPGGVRFVTVLDDEIGRTESGVGVGSSMEELREVLGRPTPQARRPRDPRISVFEALPNIRFVLDDDAVEAVMVSGERHPPRAPRDAGVPATDASSGACAAAEALEPRRDRILELAGARREADDARVTFGCLGDDPAEAFVALGDRLVVVGGEPEALRRIATRVVDGMVFAAPVDVDGDGRHEIAAVTEERSPLELIVGLEIHSLEGGRLVEVFSDDELYRLDAQPALWIGARLEKIELLVELFPESGGLSVGGLYVHETGNRVRTVAPLFTKAVSVRSRAEPAPRAGQGPDPGASDGAPASEPVHDANAAAHDAASPGDAAAATGDEP